MNGRGVRLVQGIVLASVGVVLAGCVGMPDSGGVSAVDKADKPGDRWARTVPVPPKKGDGASQIVAGYLETLRSDDLNYTTTRQYLTAEAREAFEPPTETTVLTSAPDTREADDVPRGDHAPEPKDSGVMKFRLSGHQIATLDAETGAYRPGVQEYESFVEVVKEKSGEWRISRVPGGGLVLSTKEFKRTYQEPVNTYYFTKREPEALVASPVYVRDQQVNPAAATTMAVAALVRGQGGMMAEIARSAFPANTTLAGRGAVVLEDQKLTVRLRLKTPPDRLTCRKMAAQLWYTVQNGFAARLSEVAVRAGGSQLCVLTEDAAGQYATERLTRADEHPRYYYIDDEQRLMRVPAGDGEAAVVSGPFQDGKAKIQSVAVSRDEEQVAAVAAGGGVLYSTGLGSSAVLGKPLLRSQAAPGGDPAVSGLTAPSWDGHGDLWVADRTAAGSVLYWSDGGTAVPRVVEVPGLGGDRIQALRVAAEGARIALVVADADGGRRLMLGGITRSGDRLRVQPLTEIAPQLEDVQAVSWAGDSRLAVVGRVGDGVDQVMFVETDGRLPEDRARELTVTGVSAVAASEDVSMPLVAISEQAGVVRLPVGSDWEKVASGGVAPVYPG
ncbi:Lipoprotein LpqB [Streptomyces sp. RB5]|uniref:Lipoprotein LpqB n=1 Tax=Streptomyces smaragdinus TaxID=2585196 RepID=A0A7K0CQG7_9ACTN|nr:LpqB family beta-propeller domain-containing protein [Streptomyces smaragdinus]MQY15725.1 Lipoprotein LpqB [Streptomyces smaragdinus]